MIKRKAFIHAACKYSHGTPGANYLDAFSKLLIECGLEVVLITNHNPDYELLEFLGSTGYYEIFEIEEFNYLHLEWIEEKEEDFERLFQTRTGFADDRINVMKKWEINKDDLIFI